MVGLLWITMASAVAAHEVLPTIGDMEVVGDQVTFTLEGNFESLVAGIDLDGLEDTEAAPEADVYDRLRALEPDAFVEAFNAYWPQMADSIEVLVDGQPVALTLNSVVVPAVGDVEVVRQSSVVFAGPLPAGAENIQIDWPAEFGVLVLRQVGVEAGWRAGIKCRAAKPLFVSSRLVLNISFHLALITSCSCSACSSCPSKCARFCGR